MKEKKNRNLDSEDCVTMKDKALAMFQSFTDEQKMLFYYLIGEIVGDDHIIEECLKNGGTTNERT